MSELVELFGDLNLEGLRVAKPERFIFLCGGAIEKSEDAAAIRAANLRDYLYRVRPLRLRHRIVLAEEANQLYRDTTYTDLISFEEDIARISAMVLVIAESPGALAELGAFSSNETICKTLRLLIQDNYEDDESFVRYGPVERVRRRRPESLAVYPWREHRSGGLNVRSTSPHYREIKSFISKQANVSPRTIAYSSAAEAQIFYIVLWVIYLGFALSLESIFAYVKALIPEAEENDVKNKIYCMRLAAWIDRLAYSNKVYYFATTDTDPLEYSFKSEVVDTDSSRRKQAVAAAIRESESPPKYVVSEAARARLRAVKA